MPLDLQVRVLRLLQEREIEKVGATRTIRVDIRIIAATHRNLESLVAEGKFREDLYYRLAVIPISLPPLRERTEDIVQLIKHFFEKSKVKHGRPDLALPESLIPQLVNYRWPGNVRELENVIERVVLLCESDEVTYADLPPQFQQFRPEASHTASPRQNGLEGLKAVEHNLLLNALRECNWNQTRAAQQLAISRRTLGCRMEKYGIRAPVPVESPIASDDDASLDEKMRATEVRLIKEALGAAGGNRRRAAELLKIDYKALLYRIKKLRCEIDLRKPGS